MIYEHRTYQIQAGKAGEFLKIYQAEGLGIITRYAYDAHAYLYEIPSSKLPAKQCSRWNRLVDRAAVVKKAHRA